MSLAMFFVFAILTDRTDKEASWLWKYTGKDRCWIFSMFVQSSWFHNVMFRWILVILHVDMYQYFFTKNSAGFSFEEVCYRSSLTKVPLTFSADLPMENPFSLIMKNAIYFSKAGMITDT